ncbi:MAG TPA: hypothetical protein VJU61_17210 [Polyangiaceae bacterium]|nr:hypothetical protein [Polyangiaceae bacterium]
MSSVCIRARAGRGAVLLFALVASCSLQHGTPEASDTVTNWLWKCSDSSECKGGMSCLSSRCSVACQTSAASVCTRLARGAICDEAIASCDMPCESSAECDLLGPGYACKEQRCRQADASESEAAPEPGLQAHESALAVRVAVEVEAPEPGSTDGTFAAPVEGELDLDGIFTLSDPASKVGSPSALWKDDHFQVAWSADAYVMPGARVEVTELFTTGRYVRQRLEIAATGNVLFDEDGSTVAHSDMDAHGAALMFTDLATGKTTGPTRFESWSTPQLSAVPGSDDWLITWPVVDFDTSTTHAMLARYRPGAAGFVAGPWQIASNQVQSLPSTTPIDGDSWMYWAQRSSLYLHRLGGLIAPEAPGGDYELRVDTFELPALGEPTIVPSAQGLLVISTEGAALHAFAFRPERGLGPEIEIAIPEGGREHRSQANYSSAVYAPELKRVGVCTVARAGLWFLTLDAQGRVIDRPIAIERDFRGAHEFDTRSTRGCDIAWSGESFLIVWLSVAGENDEFLWTPAGVPVEYSARGRLLRSSELASAATH